MKGNKLNEIKTQVDPKDTLRFVDQRFLLEDGTTFKIVKCGGDPTVLNEKLALANLPIQFGDYGQLPKEQRPMWRELMQTLGVDQEHWMEPDSTRVPHQKIDEL